MINFILVKIVGPLLLMIWLTALAVIPMILWFLSLAIIRNWDKLLSFFLLNLAIAYICLVYFSGRHIIRGDDFEKLKISIIALTVHGVLILVFALFKTSHINTNRLNDKTTMSIEQWSLTSPNPKPQTLNLRPLTLLCALPLVNTSRFGIRVVHSIPSTNEKRGLMGTLILTVLICGCVSFVAFRMFRRSHRSQQDNIVNRSRFKRKFDR